MAALSPEKHFELKTPKKNRSQAFKRFVLTTLMFTEQQDIQIRGANRDEKKIMMALRYPNSTHYLTYRHSLRVCCCFVVPCHLLLLLLLLSFSLMILCVSAVEGHLLLFVVSIIDRYANLWCCLLQSYVAILYLRLPPGFKIILRGREVQHHSLVDDLMYPQELTYRPQGGVAHVSKESDVRMKMLSSSHLAENFRNSKRRPSPWVDHELKPTMGSNWLVPMPALQFGC
jgi:hypothetical protein